MKDLGKTILGSSNHLANMEDHLADICSEINRIKAVHPNIALDDLILKLSVLVKHCDGIIEDIEDKSNKLDTSLKETALLASKLDTEKKQRIIDLNQSFNSIDIEVEQNLTLNKQIKSLEERLCDSVGKCERILKENSVLTEELKNITQRNVKLTQEYNTKDCTITSLKFTVQKLTNDLKNINVNNSWNRNKWLEDSVINSYFTAMEDSIKTSEILFLGPSATLAIRFSTPETCKELLQQTKYSICKYVFLCISDCSVANKQDSGSHWSLLFFDKLNKIAYHLDSLQTMNKPSAEIVASNLGIKPACVIDVPCTQQQNSFECGLHVLANAKYIVHHYCMQNKTKVSFKEWFSGDTISPLPSASMKDQVLTTNCPRETLKDIEKSKQKTKSWCKTPTNKHFKTKKVVRRTKSFISGNKFEVLNQLPDNNEPLNCSSIPLYEVTNTQANHKANNLKMTKPTNKHSNPVKKQPYLPKNTTRQKNLHKITIASDSQGRDLTKYLEHISNDRFDIFNTCQPGAPLRPIINGLKHSAVLKVHSKSDVVVIVGGTNDVSQFITNGHDSTTSYIDFLESQIKELNHTNVILATIPYRYDKQAESPENKVIKEVNHRTRLMCYNQPHVQLLDLYLLHKWQHTRHGLHINRKGKTFISREIIKTVDKFLIDNSNLAPTPAQDHQPGEMMKDSSFVSSCGPINTINANGSTELTTVEIESRPIQIIDMDMAKAFEKYLNDDVVAFAHCISRDFEDRRHMSAGVAVKFREIFGSPKHTDCLSNYLTFQQREKKAALYGLVTKEKFNRKPSLSVYNEAFGHLTNNFTKRKFNKLICSPMGCVRDLVSPDEFATNIVKFHRKTGALVEVFVSYERASRKARNGLEHDEFVKVLQTSITKALQQIDSTATASASLPDIDPLPTSQQSRPPEPEATQPIIQAPLLDEVIVAAEETRDLPPSNCFPPSGHQDKKLSCGYKYSEVDDSAYGQSKGGVNSANVSVSEVGSVDLPEMFQIPNVTLSSSLNFNLSQITETP